jgi:hypothetical protein
MGVSVAAGALVAAGAAGVAGAHAASNALALPMPASLNNDRRVITRLSRLLVMVPFSFERILHCLALFHSNKQRVTAANA